MPKTLNREEYYVIWNTTARTGLRRVLGFFFFFSRNQSYQRDFDQRKKKLRDKFEKLRPKQPTQQPSRPSTITNPILQLQQTPLPPEAIELLRLGPKFAVTPKEIPNMEIIASVEKAALQLERNGKKEDATDLRHKTTNILLNAKPPPPNLTAKERRGASFFRRNKNIAVTPFDKGQGLVTIDRTELIKKAEAEFKNTDFDTANKTSKFESQVQRSLRQLLKDGKMDDKT